MGASSSSLLDETKTNYIRGCAEAELKNFSPHYRQQYFLSQLLLLQEEVEPKRERRGQLLTQREPRGSEEVLYDNSVSYYDDSRKWKERFVVVRGNHTLELHDSQESFSAGAPPRHTEGLTGGAVLSSEESYTALVDKAFPDLGSVKEESLPSSVPDGLFPVFLHLPYSPGVIFCFRQEDQQAPFLSIMNTCIRHQNLEWSSRASRCEVLTLQKAVLLYRQEKGHYESWDLQLGSDLEVLSNLVMEDLLPSLQTDLLPRLKGKKTERRRVWMAVLQAARRLVQDQLREGLEALKEGCRQTASSNQAQVRSDLDQILASRAFLYNKVAESVCEGAELSISEGVAPCLASLQEELMEGVSEGLLALRRHLEAGMTSACLALGGGAAGGPEQLSKALAPLYSASLETCYQPVEALREKLLKLRQRFRYSSSQRLIHSTQIDMQQLMENAVHTFELLVQSAVTEQSSKLSSTTEKARLRVLKLYDFDSGVARRRIVQEALTDITLPALRRSLAPTCKPELKKFEQFIFADYSSWIKVENVYEDVLLNLLTKEIDRVLLAASSEKCSHLQVDGSNQATSQTSLSCSSDPGLNPDPGLDPDPDLNPDPKVTSPESVEPTNLTSDLSPDPTPDLTSDPRPGPGPDRSPDPNPGSDPGPESKVLVASIYSSSQSTESSSPPQNSSLGLLSASPPACLVSVVSPASPPASLISEVSPASPSASPSAFLPASLISVVSPASPPASLESEVSPASPPASPQASLESEVSPASPSASPISETSPASPPASPPASHTELSPQGEAPAASVSPAALVEPLTACEVKNTGSEIIPTGYEVIHTVTDSLAALSVTAPPTGQRQATDRAVYLKFPTATPKIQHNGTVLSNTPVGGGGTVQVDKATIVDSGTMQNETSSSDNGTVQVEILIGNNGTVQDDTPVSDIGTTHGITPLGGCGMTQGNTSVSDSGTTQGNTPVGDGSTTNNDIPLDDSGTTHGTTPLGGCGTTQGNTPVCDGGTTQSITPLGGCGTTQGNSPVCDGGTTQGNTPLGDSGTTQGSTPVGEGGTTQGNTPVGEGGTTQAEEPGSPLDSIQLIRDLVVEVIEVEDLVYRCPHGNGTA